MKTLQLFLLVVGNLAATSMTAAENQLKLQIRDGSIVILDAADRQFKWLEVEGPNSIEQMVAWADVKEIELVEAPVSEQVQRIEQLLKQLTDTDYQVREQAESTLSDPEVYGPFESLIHDALQAGDLESDYRTRRILASLEQYSGTNESQFDELVMKDGSRRLGDARDLAITGQFFGHPLTLGRKQIVQISSDLRRPEAAGAV